MADPLYLLRDDRFVPTEAATSPWSPDAQHGGPVLGLLGRAAESRAVETGLRLVRLTADLFRPVPMRPLTLVSRSLREGRRLALVQISVVAGDAEVTRGHALLLRPAKAPPSEAAPEPLPRGPEGLASEPLVPAEARSAARIGFATRIEVRWADRADGPGTALWMRLPMPLVEGEPTSPLQQVAALSDFANATATLARREWESRRMGFINADCSLFLSRPPAPGWVCLRLDRAADRDGVGTVDVSLLDAEGVLGRVAQSRLANVPPTATAAAREAARRGG